MNQPSASYQVTDAQRRQFRDNGYFVTEALFSAETLAALQSAIERRWEQAIRNAERNNPARAEIERTRAFIIQNHRHGQVFVDFLRHPVWLDMSRPLIGPDVDFQIGYTVPGLRLAATGEPFGDGVPVLRGGQLVWR